MASYLAEFGAGAAFGIALLLSGVFSPAVIASQMRLQSFHMLETYLVSGVISALLVAAADQTGRMPVNVRNPKMLGHFAFDANMIGGLLQGVGMALCAACPGTVMVQVGLGLKNGMSALFGCIVGGIAHNWFASKLRARVAPSSGVKSSAGQSISQISCTVQEALGASTGVVVLGFAALNAQLIFLLDMLMPQNEHVWKTSLAGGIWIGMAQAWTMLITRRLIGVSSSFEDVGNALVSRIIKTSQGVHRKPFWTASSVFAGGILMATVLFSASGFITLPDDAEVRIRSVSGLRALFGGAIMVFGARLAGGCTSGHGISGIASFSLSSFVTVAAMYTGGIITAAFM